MSVLTEKLPALVKNVYPPVYMKQLLDKAAVEYLVLVPSWLFSGRFKVSCEKSQLLWACAITACDGYVCIHGAKIAAVLTPSLQTTSADRAEFQIVVVKNFSLVWVSILGFWRLFRNILAFSDSFCEFTANIKKLGCSKVVFLI